MGRVNAILALAFTLTAGSSVFADEVLFNNGDRLTGKIVNVEGGKMTIDTKLAGEITDDAKDVKTFTPDGPVEIRTTDGRRISGKATGTADAGVVAVDGGG